MSHAAALGVLLRSILIEREPIYRQQEAVHGFAPGLFGLDAEAMGHVGDDRIGRALDRLFDADRAALLTETVLTSMSPTPSSAAARTWTQSTAPADAS